MSITTPTAVLRVTIDSATTPPTVRSSEIPVADLGDALGFDEQQLTEVLADIRDHGGYSDDRHGDDEHLVLIPAVQAGA